MVRILCAAFFWVLAAAPVLAQALTLGKPFGHHMVLQADQPVRLWGKGAPGEQVLTRIDGHTVHVEVGRDGRWFAEHPARAASHEPIEIEVLGEHLGHTLSDVLVGEVWVAAGQSNMTFALGRSTGAEEALAAAERPHVRLLNWTGAAYPAAGAWSELKRARTTPERYMSGAWAVASAESARPFSAVAWHFAARLDEELDVPIGIIHCSIGGTPTESWIARETLETDEDLARLIAGWPSDPRLHPFLGERAKSNLGDELASAGHPFKPGFMYAAAIAHLVRMPIRGVTWYQGESNSTDVELHAKLFRMLVRDWRRRWGIGDFPFLFCQLSSISTERGYRSELWPRFRDSQRRMLAEMPALGMAVTSDVGHRTDVHPRDKRTVGRRLALWALAGSYGWEGVASGPLYAGWRRDGARALVRFEYGVGLRAMGDELLGFELCGPDGVFVRAHARAEAEAVVVWSDGVPAPAGVRYGWTPFSTGNLVNAAGLPASTFTSE